MVTTVVTIKILKFKETFSTTYIQDHGCHCWAISSEISELLQNCTLAPFKYITDATGSACCLRSRLIPEWMQKCQNSSYCILIVPTGSVAALVVLPFGVILIYIAATYWDLLDPNYPFTVFCAFPYRTRYRQYVSCKDTSFWHYGTMTKVCMVGACAVLLLSTQAAKLTQDWLDLTMGHAKVSYWWYRCSVMMCVHDHALLTGHCSNSAQKQCMIPYQLPEKVSGAENCTPARQYWGKLLSSHRIRDCSLCKCYRWIKLNRNVRKYDYHVEWLKSVLWKTIDLISLFCIHCTLVDTHALHRWMDMW